MTDGTIYGIGNAAAALGITRRALRFLIISQSDKLGIARVGAGNGKRTAFTPELLGRIRAYRTEPTTAKRIAARAKGQAASATPASADAAKPIDTTPAPAKRKPGRPRKGAAE